MKKTKVATAEPKTATPQKPATAVPAKPVGGKPADPRPVYPQLAKLPDVSDLEIAMAIHFAADAAKKLKLDKRLAELKKLCRQHKADKKQTAEMVKLSNILTGIKSVQPFAKQLAENCIAHRKYCVELALWKKRNGKAMSKEERLVATIFGADLSKDEPKAAPKASKPARATSKATSKAAK